MAQTLYDVLAGIRRGRVVYLCPTPEQKRLLRDHEGQVALDVVRHLLGARAERSDPERFPLTEGAFQAVAGKLGYRVGQKKSRRLVARLLQAGVISSAGHYRQPYRDSQRAPASRCPCSPSSVGSAVPAPPLLSVLSARQVDQSGNSAGAGGSTRSSGTSGGYHHRRFHGATCDAFTGPPMGSASPSKPGIEDSTSVASPRV